MIVRIGYQVHDILADEERAVIIGSLESNVKRTGKIQGSSDLSG